MDIEGAPGAGKGVATAVYGVNRWDAAEFSSDAEKAKFLRIMVGGWMDRADMTSVCGQAWVGGG
jgi:hypothetical protein